MPDSEDDFDGGEEQFSSDPQHAAVFDKLGNEQRPQAAYETGPQSWSADMRQRLSSLPPEYRDIADYATTRDKEQHAAISRYGQEIRALSAQAGLPAEMPLAEAMQHLQHKFGPGPAADAMREMAEEHQAQWEPLKGVLEQYKDVLEAYQLPPQEIIGQLLSLERSLRSNPAEALQQLAQAYGHELPVPQMVQKQLSEMQQRDSQRVFDDYAKDKPYLTDPGVQAELAAEMQAILKESPGLRGKPLLRLAEEALADRKGISKQREAEREQEVRSLVAQERARHRAELQQVVAEFAKRETDREAQRQRAAEEHSRKARRASSVNVKGSPGHSTARPSFANDDDTLRAIWQKNLGGG